MGGVAVGPPEGTGDASRAVEVAREGDSAKVDLPRLASEEAEPDTRHSLDIDKLSEALDIFSQTVRSGSLDCYRKCPTKFLYQAL